MKCCPRAQCKGIAVFEIGPQRQRARVVCSRCGACTASHRDPRDAERYWDEHGAVAMGPLRAVFPRQSELETSAPQAARRGP